MNTEPEKTYASDGGHYYRRNGEPCYTVSYADPKKGMRPTTVKDCRKLDLCPSVTTILKEAAKPALETWKITQAMMSALTLPRNKDEDDATFCARIIEDSKEQARIARERGTELHGAIEHAIKAKAIPAGKWEKHITEIKAQLATHGIDLFAGDAERSFASPEGYGGKLDFLSPTVLIDFKNKPNIEDGKKYGYDEHCMQLISYAMGTGHPDARLLNIFIGCEDAKIQIIEWDKDESSRCWKMFLALLTYWKAKNKIQ